MVVMRSISIHSAAFLASTILLCYLSTNVEACKASKCVDVDIYYEALCPDSKSFIAYQLLPSYKTLKDYLDLRFVPYGKARHRKIADHWEFDCQHGESECLGNKGQACGLEAIEKYASEDEKQEISVEFVNCSMHIGYQKCVSNTLSAEAQPYVQDCATTLQGDELMVKHGDNTHSVIPYSTFIPAIAINHTYTPKDQRNIRTNFKGYICAVLASSEEKPSVCG